jgi:hypothetical protein
MAPPITAGPTMQFDNSTLCADGAHVDGLISFGAEQLAKDSANLVLTRNAAGDWSLNRTAAGAETYNVRATIPTVRRTGESLNDQLFGDGVVALPSKGVKVVDFFADYDIGVVALTTLTLRLGKTIYNASGVAFTQTDIVAATAISKVTGNLQRSVVSVASPAFQTEDFSLLEIELVAVMANTGTIKVRCLGCHFYFNYT